jgi:hypothetical protein
VGGFFFVTQFDVRSSGPCCPAQRDLGNEAGSREKVGPGGISFRSKSALGEKCPAIERALWEGAFNRLSIDLLQLAAFHQLLAFQAVACPWNGLKALRLDLVATIGALAVAAFVDT